MSVSLRPATADDAEELRRVHLVSYEDAYRDLVPASLLAERLGRHRKVDWAQRTHEERVGGGDVIVASIDGKVVGLCQFGPCTDIDDDPIEVGALRRLFVLPLFQRRGVGAALIDAACDQLRSTGRSQATLEVLATDVNRARPFYEAMGWSFDGHEIPLDEDFGPAWDGRLNDVRYRISLGT